MPKKVEKSLEDQYSSLSKSIYNIERSLDKNNSKLVALKNKQEEIKNAIELRRNYNYENHWFMHDHRKGKSFGEISFYYIKKAGELIINSFGSYTRECEIGTCINIDIENPHESDDYIEIKTESDFTRDLFVKYLKPVTEEEVKKQVKLAMHLSITDLNKSLEHKLVYNVKELNDKTTK